MKTTKLFMIVLVALLALPIAFATMPGDWWGKAYINGTLVPDGTPINAYINDKLVATTTVGAKLGHGYYELFIEANDGQLITFKIGSVNVTTYTFSDGSHLQLDLNLTSAACGDTLCNGGESCSTCSADCGACPSSGGGSTGGAGGSSGGSSGGGGSYIPPANTTNLTNTTESNATAQSNATSQTEENLTTEENLVGNESTTTSTTPTAGFWNRITGGAIALFGGNANPIIGIIIVLLIAGFGLWLFFFLKRRKKKKKK
jgi:hypothetical protein